MMAEAFVITFSPPLKNVRFNTGRMQAIANIEVMAKVSSCILRFTPHAAAMAAAPAPMDKQMTANPVVINSVIKSKRAAITQKIQGSILVRFRFVKVKEKEIMVQFLFFFSYIYLQKRIFDVA
jgi:hypothetical protein